MKLIPLERDGQVLLICPNCAYEQTNIPEVVLRAER
jgi:hypothetical protein